KGEIEPSSRTNNLIELSLEYFDYDNEVCLDYATQANSLAKKIGDSAYMVKSARIMGQMYRRQGKLDKSIEILDEVYLVAKRNNLLYDYKRILNALAAAYILKADYDKALEYNFQSLVVREQEGDKGEIS